jgi:hypothetical protein
MSIAVGQPNWVDEFGDKPRHGNIIYFFDKPEKDGKASLEAGRPVFANKVYIHKSTPGDNLVAIERPLRDQDKQDFPREWAAYEQKKETGRIDGTPLSEWPQMDRLQVAELNAINIHSVEQVANLSDSHASKIMGFNELRKKAQTYLRYAKDLVDAEKGSEEKAALKTQLEARDKEIAELKLRMELLEKMAQDRMIGTDRPRKPGRPRKDRGADTPSASS